MTGWIIIENTSGKKVFVTRDRDGLRWIKKHIGEFA